MEDITLKSGLNKLIEKYPACANYDMAIEILEFIKRNYEKHLVEQAGCQKYIDALNIGIDAIQEKHIRES